MRALVTYFLSPFTWYVVLIIIVSVMFYKKKFVLAKRFLFVTIILIFITSTSFLPEYLMKRLESKYDILKTEQLDKAEQYYIMVMGAGFSDKEGIPHTQRLPHEAMGRLVEGIRIQNELPGSIIIVAGGKGKALMRRSVVMSNAAYELGADSVLQFGEARNTLEEAKIVKDSLGIEVNLIVVTSALHMPRTSYHFKEAGFSVVPAPTNFRIIRGTRKYKSENLPNIRNVGMMADVTKEYVGLFVGRLERGKLD